MSIVRENIEIIIAATGATVVRNIQTTQSSITAIHVNV
jgi:hypothetical protein